MVKLKEGGDRCVRDSIIILQWADVSPTHKQHVYASVLWARQRNAAQWGRACTKVHIQMWSCNFKRFSIQQYQHNSINSHSGQNTKTEMTYRPQIKLYFISRWWHRGSMQDCFSLKIKIKTILLRCHWFTNILFLFYSFIVFLCKRDREPVSFNVCFSLLVCCFCCAWIFWWKIIHTQEYWSSSTLDAHMKSGKSQFV